MSDANNLTSTDNSTTNTQQNNNSTQDNSTKNDKQKIIIIKEGELLRYKSKFLVYLIRIKKETKFNFRFNL